MEKYKGKFSVARLVLSIISYVICLFILFQSCAVGFVNSVENNSDTSGTAGVILMIFMLAASSVGIATRNSRKKAGPIVAGALYVAGGLLGLLSSGGSYGDLVVWSVVSLAFGIFFIIAGVLNKDESSFSKSTFNSISVNSEEQTVKPTKNSLNESTTNVTEE